MSRVYLIARRDYLAYVGSWGFWVSLIAAPLIIALLLFAPVLLARAEPSRVLVVQAERSDDAALVTQFFQNQARQNARAELSTYLAATAPQVATQALAAFDRAEDRPHAIAAARAVAAARAPGIMRAFPPTTPRYLIAPSPSPNIEGLRPYLTGGRLIAVNGTQRPLYGALNIRRENGGAVIEYWSVNLSQNEPAQIASQAMRLALKRDALAAEGLAPEQADELDTLVPRLVQFDPRAGAGAVTIRQRAPFFASLFLTFALWSFVFSAANMLLTGVIEERSNKILDTLLTSISPMELLAGKLIGVAAVNATLLLAWGGLGGWLLQSAITHTTPNVLSEIAAAFLDPRLLAAFAVGFVAGYLIYGAIFLAIGALCDSIQDSQTLLGPVLAVFILPLMLLAPALDNPNAPIIVTASWIPLFTPFLLLLRAPAGLSWTEIAGMGAMMLVAVLIILRLAASVFHAGVVNQARVGGRRRREKREA